MKLAENFRNLVLGILPEGLHKFLQTEQDGTDRRSDQVRTIAMRAAKMTSTVDDFGKIKEYIQGDSHLTNQCKQTHLAGNNSHPISFEEIKDYIEKNKEKMLADPYLSHVTPENQTRIAERRAASAERDRIEGAMLDRNFEGLKELRKTLDFNL